jgi:hypothetical protein
MFVQKTTPFLRFDYDSEEAENIYILIDRTSNESLLLQKKTFISLIQTREKSES